MFYHAKEGTVTVDNSPMEYIRFGTGERMLVMLPGLGDSLRSMKGLALPIALMYRLFAKEFTVYMFSRKQKLSQGCTTKDLARDLAVAMDALGIASADVFGVSMGGMIAQHFAIDYPEKVGKLVLAVTSARQNPILVESVEEWVRLAKEGNHTAFMDSNMRRIYTDNYCRKNQWTIPLVGKLTRPQSYDRFFLQADACLTHDTYGTLEKIQAPTLVIGGEEDRCLGGDASREIAVKIPDAQLLMYENQGHGLYEEAKDFNHKVLIFLQGEAL